MKKTTAILFSTVLIFCTCFTAKAQDVDGISLGSKYTIEQLIEIYGEPIKHESHMDELADGRIDYIKFKDIWVELLWENRIIAFGIKSEKPRAMTEYVKGGIGIGDSVEILDNLEEFFFKKILLDDGTLIYKYLFNEDSLRVYTKLGNITNIEAVGLL